MREIRGNPKMAKEEIKCTEKEFLEWKVDFLRNQAELLNAPLEAGDVPDEEIELFEKDIRNIKTWIRELKARKREEYTENLKWKPNFLKEQLENVNMNLEYMNGDYKELLYEDARNIKAWIKEFEDHKLKTKTDRNDPCPCGSGKKYKKCCGNPAKVARERKWKEDKRTIKKNEKSNKTVIFDVIYIGQCGCGYEEEIIRKIELKETQSLDDLHEAIIYKSFKWNDPHMYSFFFDNIAYSRNRKMEYFCNAEPDIDGKMPNSSSIKLRELNLRKNQKFLFVFDFGDDHHFGIKVESFGEIQKDRRYPLVLGEKGKAPGQYPDYDE